jgi:hypothetical protein
MNQDSGIAMIVFRGRPRGTYVLQAKNALSDSEWSNISTNTAGGTGNGVLRDNEAKNHSVRFYRVATP